MPALLHWPWSLVWLGLAAVVVFVFAAIDDRRRDRRAALEQLEQDADQHHANGLGCGR